MSDNSSPFDFDDDNLDWLNAELDPADDTASGPAEPGQSSAPLPAPPSSGGSTVPPWQQNPGGQPPAPRQTTAPAPWQQRPGGAPPPPAAPRMRPPWGESAPPPAPPVSAAASGPASLADDDLSWLAEDDEPVASAAPVDDDLAWLSEDDTADTGAGDEFGTIDWDGAERAPEVAQGGSELPEGMTGFLPWRQEASDDDADDLSMADLAGLSDDTFAAAGLFDDEPGAADTGSGFMLDDDLFDVDEPASEDALDFGDDFFAVDEPASGDALEFDDDFFATDDAASPGAEPPAPEPPAPAAPTSLRDRLLAASPPADSAGGAADLGDLFDEEPADAGAADLSDLFDEEPADAGAADLSDLFGDEPDTAGVADLGDLFDEEPATSRDDLSALSADDFAADEPDTVGVTGGADDSWLDDAFEEFSGEVAEPAAAGVDEDAGDDADDLGMQFSFDDMDDEDEAEELPDWLQGDVEFDEPEPEPEPEPAPRGIRRIAPAAAADEPSSDMESWLGADDWDAPESDSTLDDLTYEEWEILHDEEEQAARRESELLESVPDMFLPTDGQPDSAAPSDAPPSDAPPSAADTGPQFVPGWFVGLEDAPQDDAPEWFQQADFSGDFMAAPVAPTPADDMPDKSESAGGDVPEWFKAPELPADDTPDWFKAPAAPVEEPSIEPPAEDEDEADLAWMASPTATPEESDSLPLPKTGALFGLETPIPQPDIEGPPPGAGDSWLDEVRLAAAQDELDEQVLPQTGQLFASSLPDQPEREPADTSPDQLDDLLADLPDDIEIEPPSGDELAGLPLPGTGDLFGGLTDDEAPDRDDALADLPLPGTGALFGGLVDGSGLDDMAQAEDDEDMFPEAAFGTADDMAFDAGEVWDDDEEAATPGELPDWLPPAAAEDQRIDPTDVPFPDIDLDQTMPGEMAASDLLAGEPAPSEYETSVLGDTSPTEPPPSEPAEASPHGYETSDLEGEPPLPEPWMAEFAPQGDDAAFFLPKSPGTSPLVDDFVERFDPMEPEPTESTEVPEPEAPEPEASEPARSAQPALGDDAPAWLRELGDEGALLDVPDDVNLVAEDAASGTSGDFDLGLEEDMDWLSAITEDTVAEPVGDEPPIDFSQVLTVPGDRLPQVADAGEEADQVAEPADETPEPSEDEPGGVLHTAPLDSHALDALLGLDDAVLDDTTGIDPARMPALPPDSELAARAQQAAAEAAEPEESLDDLEALFANAPAGGTGALPALFDEQLSAEESLDLAALLDEAEAEFPDAADLSDEEALDLFPDDPFEATPAAVVPDVRPKLRQPAAEPEPAEAEQPKRRRRFGRRAKQDEMAQELAEAPDEFVDVQEAAEAEERPDWIAEMRPEGLPVAIRVSGAEISLKQKQVIELPERLRVFYERAQQELAAPETLPAADSGPLAGIAGALPAADVMQPTAADRPVEGLIITPEQEKRIGRLNALLELAAAEEQEFEVERAELEEAAETFSYDEYDDEEGERPEPEPEPMPARSRRKRRFKFDRVLIALLMLAALVVPFFSDVFHFASDPPPLGEEQATVADMVDVLAQPDAYVLFAFEYGPTSAGELDPLAEAVIRDVIAHGAIPLTISTNPAGALHAAAVIEPLVEDAALLAARDQSEDALVEGEDYVLLRYLTGEAVGVRSLLTVRTDGDGNVQQHPAFQYDLRGDETDLAIGNLAQDIAFIVVIGEDSSAIRTWAEQLHPLPTVPKLALVTAAIEPLTTPYVFEETEIDITGLDAEEIDALIADAEAKIAAHQGYYGYLAGMRDTYSYNAARNTANRTPYEMPADAPDLPDPETSQWHSTALGAAMAALLIALGMMVNLLRGLRRRR